MNNPATPSSSRRKFFWLLPVGLIVLWIVLTAFRSGDSLSATDKFTASDQASSGAVAGKASENSDDDPFLGKADAPFQVIAFEDFQCPYCREEYPIIRQVLSKYQDRIHFIYRDFPLTTIHAEASIAAQAGQCAWAQGANIFWSLHDRIYQNQDALSQDNLIVWAELSGADRDKLAACLLDGTTAAEVAQDFSDGLAAGVRGTPTFFINGRKVEGAIPLDVWERILQ